MRSTAMSGLAVCLITIAAPRAPAARGGHQPARVTLADTGIEVILLPAGTFTPNRWGLFDMPGDVWTWTSDLHCPYDPAGSIDPVGRCATELRVIRGGSWIFGADSARCALRYTHHPDDRGPSLGFRVAMDGDE